MQETHQKQTLRSRIIRTDMVRWRDFNFIQQDDFKELPKEARNRLRASILANDFTQPFYLWQQPGKVLPYCLDGKHRVSVLEELANDGYDIPDQLPATFIHCDSIQDAARLVLVYSSMYARITDEGLNAFLNYNDLSWSELSEMVAIPDIDGPIMPEVKDPFDDSGIAVKNQYGVIVICESAPIQEEVFNELTSRGYNCKIVVT